MDYWDYIAQAKSLHEDPKEAWKWAVGQRSMNQDPELADAEHYLWNRYYSGQGPVQAFGGMLQPFGYSLAKQFGLLSGSEPTMRQLKAGLQGGFEGMGL